VKIARLPSITRLLAQRPSAFLACVPVLSRRSFSTNPSLLHAGSSLPIGLINPGDENLIIRSPWPEVEIPETNLADFVWENVEEYSDKPALVCGMTGRSYSFGLAHGMSRKFGSALLRMGAKKGDVFGMVLPNIPEFPIAFLGAAGVGVTVTTMNPTYRPEEIAKQMDTSGTKYVITIGMFLQNIKQAADIYGGIEKIIVLGMDDVPSPCVSFQDMIIGDDGSLYDQDRSCDPHNDVVVMPFSSGTTGPPKGVCLTHYNLVANCMQAKVPGVMPHALKNLIDDGVQETTVAVLPFFHIYSMELIMLLNMRIGTRIVTLPKFEPETYIKSLVTYKPTVLNLVPPLVGFLATNPAVKSSHLSSVKVVTGGAAPFGPSLIEKFMEKVAPGVIEFREGFGMTETSPLTHLQPEEGAVLGGCGCPVSNTVAKIIDVETGALLEAGEPGELCVSGPQVMQGYFNNKEATNKTIIDGWLHTGDIAIYDDTKQFVIVDRLKELIKVKGLQVSPSELEDLIRRHPGVLDVAVVGVPDERLGESPRAYIIRKNANVAEQSIIDYVADRVAPHKKLGQGVMFVDSLPKNQTGKILRRELKAQVFKGSFGY